MNREDIEDLIVRKNKVIKELETMVDTILEEDHNVNFYKQAGFVEIEREVEHEGLSFVTLIKKR